MITSATIVYIGVDSLRVSNMKLSMKRIAEYIQ